MYRSMYSKMLFKTPHLLYIVSKEPLCARFRRVFTSCPIVKIHKTQCILPSFVNSGYMSNGGNDETR